MSGLMEAVHRQTVCGGRRLKPRFWTTFLIWIPFNLGQYLLQKGCKTSFWVWILLLLFLVCFGDWVFATLALIQIFGFGFEVNSYCLNFLIFFEFFKVSSWFIVYPIWIEFFYSWVTKSTGRVVGTMGD